MGRGAAAGVCGPPPRRLRSDWVAGLKLPVVAHDGAHGTVGEHVGSKFFDGLIKAGRVVDREVEAAAERLGNMNV